MSYLVSVWANLAQAQAATQTLVKADIPTHCVTILGEGFKSADEYGLEDPRETANQQRRLMAFWLVPFGVFGGVTFNRMTNLDTFAAAGSVASYVVSGIVGALSGLLGSVFIGGGTNSFYFGKEAVPYRKRLSNGKYIVAVNGTDMTLRRSNKLLRELDPESLQFYGESTEF
jgi:hypothetical protein